MALRDRTWSWIDDAACTHMDPAIFFPDARNDTALAKRICGECPVRTECLEDALTAPIPPSDGVFGGLDPQERDRLRKQRALGRAVAVARNTRTTPRKAEL